MEAWWWLSAPYSATFPLTMALFHVSGDHDIVPLLAMLAAAMTLSAIGWMLTTIYQVRISKKVEIDRTKVTMMAVVVLACVAWAAQFK